MGIILRFLDSAKLIRKLIIYMITIRFEKLKYNIGMDSSFGSFKQILWSVRKFELPLLTSGVYPENQGRCNTGAWVRGQRSSLLENQWDYFLTFFSIFCSSFLIFYMNLEKRVRSWRKEKKEEKGEEK